MFEPGQTWGHGLPPHHENGPGREQARPLEGWGPRAKALRAGAFFPHLKKNEVALTYNVVLTTAVQQSGSVLHIYTYIYIYIYTHTHLLFHILFQYG